MPAEVENAHMRDKPRGYIAAADMILEVSERRFLVHSLVLRESEVLSDMLDVVAPEGGPNDYAPAPEGGAKSSPPLMVFNLSGGGTGLPDAVTADAVAALLNVLYNPYDPSLPSGQGVELAIPAAHFFNIPSVLKLCDVGLKAHVADRFSWNNPNNWNIDSDNIDLVPADLKMLEFGERYALPHVAAGSLASVLWKLTRTDNQRTGAEDRQVERFCESMTGLVGKVVAKELCRFITLAGSSQMSTIASSYEPDVKAIADLLKREMNGA